MKPITVDRTGGDLRVGDMLVQDMPDGTYSVHRIDRFGAYPKRCVDVSTSPRRRRTRWMQGLRGDEARIAYGPGDPPRWRKTILAQFTYHVLVEVKAPLAPPEQPPAFSLLDYGYEMPAFPHLIGLDPLVDPALVDYDPALVGGL